VWPEDIGAIYAVYHTLSKPYLQKFSVDNIIWNRTKNTFFNINRKIAMYYYKYIIIESFINL